MPFQSPASAACGVWHSSACNTKAHSMTTWTTTQLRHAHMIKPVGWIFIFGLMNVNDNSVERWPLWLHSTTRTGWRICSLSYAMSAHELIVFIVIIIHVAWQWKQFNRTVNLKWHLAVAEVSELHRCAYKISLFDRKTDKPESSLYSSTIEPRIMLNLRIESCNQR